MKTNVTSIGLIILALIIIIYIIFLNECKRPTPCPPPGKILIAQSSWDSIKAIANKPPIVTIDTFWIRDTITIPNPQPPIPQPQPDTSTVGVNQYSDSLILKDVNAWYNFKVKGTLLTRTWAYRPRTLEIHKDSIVYVPKVVEVLVPQETAANHMYFEIMYGTEFKEFWSLPGLGTTFISKKDFSIGYMYQRMDKTNFHSIKLGVRIF
jgi:hypothetical protein